MPSPKVSEPDFVRLCYTLPSIEAIARELQTDAGAVRRRMNRLEHKYGNLRPKGYYPQQVESRGGHLEDISLDKCTVVVFSDAHYWPELYTDIAPAHLVLLKMLPDIKPDIVVNLGDVFDGFSVSRHPPHGWTDGPTVAEELEVVQLRLGEIAERSSKAKLIWCWGNHDARFDSRLSAKAGEFKDVPGFTLQDHFPAWKMCQGFRINNILQGTHAWKGGEHAAYNDAKAAGISYITGHDHTLWARPYTDLNGVRFGMKSGTLSDINAPAYFYRNKNPANWQSGFMIIHIDGDRLTPEPVWVIDGKAKWRGNDYNSL